MWNPRSEEAAYGSLLLDYVTDDCSVTGYIYSYKKNKPLFYLMECKKIFLLKEGKMVEIPISH